MHRKLAGVLLLTALLTSFRAIAEEPLFGYVSTTDLLPKGKFETAQWLTWRDGKPIGEFDVVEGRTEFEYGVSDRFQIAAYANYEWANAYHNNVLTGATLAPASLSNLVVGANEHLNTTRFNSASLEGIYRLWSPIINPLGVALYVRPSIGPQLREVEARLILQKNFADDRLVMAFNIGDTADWRDIANNGNIYDRTWTDSSTLAFGLAGSFRFATGWSAGAELQNEDGYTGTNPFKSDTRTSVAYYTGPALHYANEHMFATLTCLTQLPLASDYSHTHPDFDVDGRNYAAGNERLRVRIKFGWYF